MSRSDDQHIASPPISVVVLVTSMWCLELMASLQADVTHSVGWMKKPAGGAFAGRLQRVGIYGCSA